MTLRRVRRTGLDARVLVLLAVAAAIGCGRRDADDGIADLETRIRAYVAIHRRVAATSPAPGASDARQRALAAALLASPDVHADLLFTTASGAAVRRRLASLLQGTAGKNVRGTILDANPSGLRVVAPAPYPADAPLPTVPTAVLEALPPLPDELEYRFVGRHLIVRDVAANLVVDVLRDAFE